MSEQENNQHYCDKCKIKFNNKDDLEKHNWKIHPTNKYEKAWSQINFSTYAGSSYYKDDPYY